MPPTVDEPLRALRLSHHDLAEIAGRLDAAALDAGSYCRDWSRAQVFSHLGSGAEIALGNLRAGLGEGPEPDHEAVWARWNALPPDGMARGFVESDDRYLTAVERLDPARREALRVPFFLGPTELAAVLTFRLHEHTLHAWDIRVTLDPHATLRPEAVPLLLDVPPALVRWTARPTEGTSFRLAMHITEPERHYVLAVQGGQAALHEVGTAADAADAVDAVDAAEAAEAGGATGRLDLPGEAYLRLVSGRLDPDHTPAAVQARGRPTLDELRALFPGY